VASSASSATAFASDAQFRRLAVSALRCGSGASTRALRMPSASCIVIALPATLLHPGAIGQ
jgi:hypothetical protein